MRKLVLFAAVVCLISCYGVNAFGQNVRYVQSPPTKFAANHGGLTGMNQTCINNYGGTAHMCTTSEFFATAFAPGAGAVFNAWVQPALHDCYSDPNNGGDIYCLEGGSSTPVPVSNLTMDCSGWSSTSGDGTAASYNSTTGWTLVNPTCISGPYRIACCIVQ
jgi:hypothetical protein